jgi:hypothetical protein
VAVLGLLGWALVWAFVSDQFYVTQIVVDGNHRISADVIRQASGLLGYSSFWIHPAKTAARIMESLPPITSVQVHHDLSNTVTLRVQERQEQIMWQISGPDGASGMRYWVSEDGKLSPVPTDDAQRATVGRPADWTLLVKDLRSNPDDVLVGTLSVEPGTLAAARQILYLLPKVRVVEYAPTFGLRFLHPRGWLVYLGAGGDMAYKVSVLRAFEVQFSGPDVLQPALVDLRYPDSPFYRLPDDVSANGYTPSGGE